MFFINVKLLIAAILFVSIDYLYLSNVKGYFDKQLIRIQNEPVKLNLSAAILCYIFLIVGLYYFVLKNNRPVIDAVILGLVIYMVYETTNKAIISKWDWTTVLIDGVWGGILFGLTTYLTYKIVDLLKLE